MRRKVEKIVYFYPENLRFIYTREFTVRLHSVSPGFYQLSPLRFYGARPSKNATWNRTFKCTLTA